MFTYKFVIKETKGNSLFLRITSNRRTAELSLGIKADPESLKKAINGEGKCGGLDIQVLYWRGIIAEVRNEVSDDVDACAIKNTIIQKDLARSAAHQTGNTPTNLFADYMKKVGQTKSKSTSESFVYTLSTMNKFDKNTSELTFESITYTWLSDFEDWMKQAGLSQNTRKIHFGNIRIAMREAFKRELTDNDPFRRFSFRPEKTRKRSLSVDELRSLFDYPVEPYAEIYRDMYKLIFMLCGINTVDLYNLKRISPSGRIDYKRAKTGREYSIRVEPEALALIEKYKGVNNLLCLADRWSDHRNFRHQMNKAIKDIGVSQGKGRKRKTSVGEFDGVTSYWMRHSWATIARSLGVSKDDISLALGHGDGNPVTSVYIDEDLKVVDEANRRVIDWVLYNKR